MTVALYPQRVGFTIIILLMLPSQGLAKREHPEKWYQERWCREHGGQVEVVLPDKTRCDWPRPSTSGSAYVFTIQPINLSNEIHGSDSVAYFIGTNLTLESAD